MNISLSILNVYIKALLLILITGVNCRILGRSLLQKKLRICDTDTFSSVLLKVCQLNAVSFKTSDENSEQIQQQDPIRESKLAEHVIDFRNARTFLMTRKRSADIFDGDQNYYDECCGRLQDGCDFYEIREYCPFVL